MTHKSADVQTDSAHQEQRRQLVVQARDIVRNHGMAALNLQALAEQAHLPLATLEPLFGDTPGLIRALYESWVEEWQRRLMAALPETPPEAMLRQAAYIYRELACSDRALFLAASTPVAIEADLFGMLSNSTAFEMFANFIKAGMAQRKFRITADPDATVRTLWAGIHGAVLIEICSGYDERTGKRRLEEGISLLTRGLQQ
ncbi:TetR/AcrR family transcriptional regulator [Marinobacter sp. SS21]|uniref:TetR/AcrR family transcriptional regulator n=1 Tax=Marinobacter sp. SS21 TaxID=2979460 RepID=UPI00232CC93A|nr:hypothetical protein [Marinobacter sp. SS21]MDC0663657.1 hypothetical protein [Marinobacter sp. SS21]